MRTRPRTPRPLAAWLLLLAAAGPGGGCADEASPPPPEAGPADGAATPTVRRTALLIHLQGEVHVKRPGAPDWQLAEQGLELQVQDKVRTRRDALPPSSSSTAACCAWSPRA